MLGRGSMERSLSRKGGALTGIFCDRYKIFYSTIQMQRMRGAKKGLTGIAIHLFRPLCERLGSKILKIGSNKMVFDI